MRVISYGEEVTRQKPIPLTPLTPAQSAEFHPLYRTTKGGHRCTRAPMRLLTAAQGLRAPPNAQMGRAHEPAEHTGRRGEAATVCVSHKEAALVLRRPQPKMTTPAPHPR